MLTPFLGVGSEVFCAVRSGRQGIGVELKPSYFRQAKKNVARANDPKKDDLFNNESDEPDEEDL
jgi:DNA modification methylase